MSKTEIFPFAAEGMQRVAFGVEYHGAQYNGWQRQKNTVSVQGELEKALSVVANHPVQVQCAGRTDSGVHASAQVVHFDSPAKRNERNWLLGVNANLPDDIAVHWVKRVDERFHARFSAIVRRYRYIILAQHPRSALLAKKVTWSRAVLDEVKMHAAAQHLVGTHDFTSYRALHCQAKSPVRTMHSLDVSREGDFIYLDVSGNAFLHHMIRNIAGVLMAIGAGDKDVDWSREILEQRDRRQGGVTAKPWGLYLVHVEYPKELEIEQAIRRPSFNFF